MALSVEDHLVIGSRVGRRVPVRLAYDPHLKRVVDLALGSLSLLLSLPLWLAIAVAIRLDSPGPFLFVQERVGLRGERFRFYKFRTMQVGAEHRLAELLAANEAEGPAILG